MESAVAEARRATADLIFCDLDPWETTGLGAFTAFVRASALPCPMIVRHGATTFAAREIALLAGAGAGAGLHVSLRAYDAIGMFAYGRDRWPGNATLTVLAGFDGRPELPVEIIALLTILCERRVMQADVARAMGISSSGMRLHLSQLRKRFPEFPRFPTANAAVLALHVLWRRERLGWTAKRAAALAGFPSEKACANYLNYHLDASSTQLMHGGGFASLLEVVRRWFG